MNHIRKYRSLGADKNRRDVQRSTSIEWDLSTNKNLLAEILKPCPIYHDLLTNSTRETERSLKLTLPTAVLAARQLSGTVRNLGMKWLVSGAIHRAAFQNVSFKAIANFLS